MRVIAAFVGILFALVGLAVVLWVSGEDEKNVPHELVAPADPPAYLARTTSRIIESAITGRTYQVSVALPRTYDQSGESYPVLYAVDANGQFGTVVETARSMADYEELVPELIIVGIGYPEGGHFAANGPKAVDLTPTKDAEWEEARAASEWPAPDGSGGAPAFLRFLREELIPLIEDEYRADAGDRALYGHSLGDLFAFHALLHGEGTFHKLIVASPSLWWDERVSFDHEAVFAEENEELPARVFFAVGELEDSEEYSDEVWGYMATDLRELVEVLERREYDGLEFEARFFADETHNSVIAPTISRGLRYIYSEDR